MLYIRESNSGQIFLQVADGIGSDMTFHSNDGMALSDCRTLATGVWAIDDDPDNVLSAKDLEGIPIVAEYDDGKWDFGVIRIAGNMGIRARQYIGNGEEG